MPMLLLFVFLAAIIIYLAYLVMPLLCFWLGTIILGSSCRIESAMYFWAVTGPALLAWWVSVGLPLPAEVPATLWRLEIFAGYIAGGALMHQCRGA